MYFLKYRDGWISQTYHRFAIMSRNSREAIINGDSVYLTKLAKKWFLCDLNAIIQYMINLNVCPDTRRRNECWRQLSCVAHDMTRECGVALSRGDATESLAWHF